MESSTIDRDEAQTVQLDDTESPPKPKGKTLLACLGAAFFFAAGGFVVPQAVPMWQSLQGEQEIVDEAEVASLSRPAQAAFGREVREISRGIDETPEAAARTWSFIFEVLYDRPKSQRMAALDLMDRLVEAQPVQKGTVLAVLENLCRQLPDAEHGLKAAALLKYGQLLGLLIGGTDTAELQDHIARVMESGTFDAEARTFAEAQLVGDDAAKRLATYLLLAVVLSKGEAERAWAAEATKAAHEKAGGVEKQFWKVCSQAFSGRYLKKDPPPEPEQGAH